MIELEQPRAWAWPPRASSCRRPRAADRRRPSAQHPQLAGHVGDVPDPRRPDRPQRGQLLHPARHPGAVLRGPRPGRSPTSVAEASDGTDEFSGDASAPSRSTCSTTSTSSSPTATRTGAARRAEGRPAARPRSRRSSAARSSASRQHPARHRRQPDAAGDLVGARGLRRACSPRPPTSVGSDRQRRPAGPAPDAAVRRRPAPVRRAVWLLVVARGPRPALMAASVAVGSRARRLVRHRRPRSAARRTPRARRRSPSGSRARCSPCSSAPRSALAGAVMQGVTRNPLADPGILGVNMGASLAVVTGIAYVRPGRRRPATSGSRSPAPALSAVFVYAVGSLGRGGATPLKLALAGAATSAALASFVTRHRRCRAATSPGASSPGRSAASAVPPSTSIAPVAAVPRRRLRRSACCRRAASTRSPSATNWPPGSASASRSPAAIAALGAGAAVRRGHRGRRADRVRRARRARTPCRLLVGARPPLAAAVRRRWPAPRCSPPPTSLGRIVARPGGDRRRHHHRAGRRPGLHLHRPPAEGARAVTRRRLARRHADRCDAVARGRVRRAAAGAPSSPCSPSWSSPSSSSR